MGIHVPNNGIDTDFLSPGQDYFRIYMKVRLESHEQALEVRELMEREKYEAVRNILMDRLMYDEDYQPVNERAVELVQTVRRTGEPEPDLKSRLKG